MTGGPALNPKSCRRRPGGQTVRQDHRIDPHHADPWTQRRDAVAIIRVSCARGRYQASEVVIGTTYRYRYGDPEIGRTHRVYLGNATGPVIRELWNRIFDTVAEAQQFEPRLVLLRLALEDMPRPWSFRVRAIAEIVGYELGVLVQGTAFDSLEGSAVSQGASTS